MAALPHSESPQISPAIFASRLNPPAPHHASTDTPSPQVRHSTYRLRPPVRSAPAARRASVSATAQNPWANCQESAAHRSQTPDPHPRHDPPTPLIPTTRPLDLRRQFPPQSNTLSTNRIADPAPTPSPTRPPSPSPPRSPSPTRHPYSSAHVGSEPATPAPGPDVLAPPKTEIPPVHLPYPRPVQTRRSQPLS